MEKSLRIEKRWKKREKIIFVFDQLRSCAHRSCCSEGKNLLKIKCKNFRQIHHWDERKPKQRKSLTVKKKEKGSPNDKRNRNDNESNLLRIYMEMKNCLRVRWISTSLSKRLCIRCVLKEWCVINWHYTISLIRIAIP